MEFYRIEAPKSKQYRDQAIALLLETFGEEEARMEERQLSGEEQTQNRDSLYIAMEHTQLAGTCHLTVPRQAPQLGAISGVCTSPAFRRNGIAKSLLSAAIRDFTEQGGQALFLGTESPDAAALYRALDFTFLPGSNVMMRSTKALGQFLPKTVVSGQTAILKGDASFRVPLIPLCLSRIDDTLMDYNAGILSTNRFTQCSCSRLFPRYEALLENGGVFYGVQDQDGFLVAAATVQPVTCGNRIDCFSLEGCESVLPDLLYECASLFFDVFAEIAECDTKKQKLFSGLGFRRRRQSSYRENGISLPCSMWKK